MRILEIEITPDLAAEFLAASAASGWANYRTINEDVVAKYAKDMVAGRWHRTGDTIKITDDGFVVDGQHRLAACVQANCSFWSVVVFGVEHDVNDYVDIGRRRTMVDALRNQGLHGVKNLAAAARVVISFNADRVTDSRWVRKLTNSELLLFIKKNEEAFARATEISTRMRRTSATGGAASSAFVFLADERYSRSRVDPFLEAVITGENLSAGNAALTLRNWFTGPSAQRRGDERLVHLSAFIRAWTYWYKEMPMTKIYPYRPGDPSSTYPNFPSDKEASA